jgi:hypothetical protein
MMRCDGTASLDLCFASLFISVTLSPTEQNPTPQYVVEMESTAAGAGDADGSGEGRRTTEDETDDDPSSAPSLSGSERPRRLQPFSRGLHRGGGGAVAQATAHEEPSIHAYLEKFSQRAVPSGDDHSGAGGGGGGSPRQSNALSHVHPISFVKYFPELDRVVVVEKGARKFKLYHPHTLRHEKTVHSPHGPITSGLCALLCLGLSSESDAECYVWCCVGVCAVELIGRFRLLVCCTEQNYLVFYDAREFYVLKRSSKQRQKAATSAAKRKAAAAARRARAVDGGSEKVPEEEEEEEEEDDEAEDDDDDSDGQEAAGNSGDERSDSEVAGETTRDKTRRSATDRSVVDNNQKEMESAKPRKGRPSKRDKQQFTKPAADRHMTLQMAWAHPDATIALCWSGRTLFASDTTGLLYGYKLEHSAPFYTMTGHTDIIMHM